MAAVHTTLGFKKVCQFQGACTHLFAHAPHAGAGAEFLTAPFAVEHGAAADTDGGQIDTGCTHDE